MDTINLNKKTEALEGTVEAYWFENQKIGLKKTLFHRITIPLKPFDSGLEYEEQPLKTEIVFEWYALNLSDPTKIEGLNLSHKNYPEAEASVYIGSAHNWCNVLKLQITRIALNIFNVACELVVEFQNEGVAKNESFSFNTNVTYIGA